MKNGARIVSQSTMGQALAHCRCTCTRVALVGVMGAALPVTDKILTKPTRKDCRHIACLKHAGSTTISMVTVNLATYAHTSTNVRFVASMATLGTSALIN